MLILALGVFHVMQGDVGQTLREWIRKVHLDPDGHLMHEILEKITGTRPKMLQEIAFATLLMATIFSVEGIGLMMGKRWAEWLTVVASSLLIPLEIYECIEKVHPMRVALLVINVLIVVYLARHVWKNRPHKHGAHG